MRLRKGCSLSVRSLRGPDRGVRIEEKMGEQPLLKPNSRGDGEVPVNLVDCSLEDLISALLQQRPVAVPGGADFLLHDDNARRIFGHYVRNRHLWPRARPVLGDEVEGVLQALAAPLPVAAPGSSRATGRKTWRLTRLEAHRFAGLHRHCGTDGEDPAVFALDLDRDVTLVGGFNGAGKTALQNVIVWCLTGRALRSQHMPDEIHQPMKVHWTGGRPIADGGNEPALALPPVVPIPTAAELESLGERAKIDTWAQLTFRDPDSEEMRVVRRRLTVGPRGKISMAVDGLAELGLTDLAIEVGTLMPGIAGQMRFDEQTTFATAVATLTGLKPLEDLGRRSERVVRRLEGEETVKAERAATDKVHEFNRWRRSMRDAWTAQPDLGDPVDLLGPDDRNEPEQWSSLLADARRRLESIKEKSEERVEAMLGRRLETAAEANALLEQLGDALDALKAGALKGLRTIAVAGDLAAVTEDDMASVQALIGEMVERAEAVAGRLTRPEEAARWQLYASVAAWHHEHHAGMSVDDCPVCGTDLAGVPEDAVLGRGIADALQLCRDVDGDVAKGVEEWERDASREFLERLPKNLRGFADHPPPEGLLEIYRKAYVDELLADRSFAGPLQALKTSAERVWDLAVADHPLSDGPTAGPSVWPRPFERSRLARLSASVERAVRLARLRSDNTTVIRGLVQRYVGRTNPREVDGTQGAPARTGDGRSDELPLRDQAEELRRCVSSATPILSLLRQLDELDSASNAHAETRGRLARIGEAAAAMAEFARLPDLVFHQVTGLITALDEGTRTWLERIYRPHYRGGPAYSRFDATQEKGLGLLAGVGEVEVDAYRIMNASQLRACVWAFVFSLWERVRARVGGIDSMLLDDPQDQFDPINSENLAAAIAEMPAYGMRPIVTSNDYRFLDAVRDKLPAHSTTRPSWYAGFMSPISNSRLTAGVGPAPEEIGELRRSWQADDNNEHKARQFVSAVRINVENRLWDFLARGPFERQRPTLSDLINALRTARNHGELPFEEPPFAAFLSHPELRDSAPFYRCINKAHHRPQDVTPHDAGDVDRVFGEIDRLLRSCSAAYGRFMGRLTREDGDLLIEDLPPAPPPMVVRREPLRVLGQVSARSSADLLAAGLEGDVFEFASLGAVACYGVRSPGLSPLALQGQVVVVSLEADAKDGDPVVALCGGRGYLRRFLGDDNDPSRIVLACDRSGTERVPPTLLLPRARTKLLPVVGVVYDDRSFDGRDEVVEVQGSELLERRLVAARVADDSAFPIIRAGDLVLMERVASLDTAEVARLDDSLVVAAAGTGTEVFAYLKRLGGHAAPGVRILENIGLKGRAVSVAIGHEGVASGVAPLQMLWRVHGTIRSPK